MRNDFYVYAHYDLKGNCFYIGKGTDKRAFKHSNSDRNEIWHYYVNKYLDGQYEARIIMNDLTESEAESIEYDLLIKYGFNTVNWINPCRTCNLELNRKYHYLVGINKKLIEDSKYIEETDIDKAIEGYREVIAKISLYNNLPIEWLGENPALVDKIYNEMGGNTKKGEIIAIDRLTHCLCKKGLKLEAKMEAINYFENFPYDFVYKGYVVIMKRVYKGEEIPFDVIRTFKKRDEWLENQGQSLL